MWAHYTSIPASAGEFMSNGHLCGVSGIFPVWPGRRLVRTRRCGTCYGRLKNREVVAEKP